MKLLPWNRLAAAGALVAAASLWTNCDRGPDASAATQADYQAQLRSEAAARAQDPAWKPSHQEVAVIRVTKAHAPTLNNFCLDAAGNVLACMGGGPTQTPGAVEVYSPEGKLLQTWALQSEPQAICRDPDGTIIVAGKGQILRLDGSGKVLATKNTPTAELALPPDEDLKALAERFGQGTPEQRLKELKQYLTQRRTEVTGLAVLGEDVFVACPSTKDWTMTVYRVDREFKNPKLIVDKLTGCCGQMDIQARDGKLWIAHNGRHRVQAHDREGKQVAAFGKQDRKSADGFGGCCEPKNLRLTSNGEVLAAESGPPVTIKRFTAEGKFLGVAALPTFKLGCVRTTVDASPDGQRYYILNSGEGAIHVFAARG